MIKLIQSLLNKLFIFNKTKKTNIVLSDHIPSLKKDIHICEINFRLTDSQEIEIEFLHPDIRDSSVEEIATIAENCANLIVMINSGLVKKQLISTIKHYKKKNMNNDKNTLLIDNILFFNNLLQEELKIIKKEIGPLIKPSSVFRS